MTMYSNGQTVGMTTQGITAPVTGGAGSLPGTAGVAPSQEYYGTQNTTTYYSNNFGNNFGATGGSGGRHHLQTAAPLGPLL